MEHDITAGKLIDVLGGSENVLACNVCMTRLRITLADASRADLAMAAELDGVLGVVTRTAQGIEVVFGPGKVEEVHRAIKNKLNGIEDSAPPAKLPQQNITVAISPARRHSYKRQAEALASLFDEHDEEVTATKPVTADVQELSNGPRVIVINGPNINLLGLREPDVYGSADYTALIASCRKAASEAGFSECRIYQSNHEGDLIDRIQRAHGRYDGIVINPGGYTHTSIALLDALRAVRIPAVEVHISDVSSRESFRQISYVGMWCFKTISGHGIAGYEEAMHALAEELSKSLPRDGA